MRNDAGPRSDVVLVGGGHAHVQVLKRWAMKPPRGARLTVVVDRAEAVYSGMVPGFVAGEYAERELVLDVVPLAARARARLVLAPATRIDADARTIELMGRPPLHYDVVSLDVGSTVRGLDLPGVREHAIATRPIGRFVRELDRVDELLRSSSMGAEAAAPRAVVVGAGAAGVELAFALVARAKRAGGRLHVTLVDGGSELLPGYPDAARSAALELARERGIEPRLGARAAALTSEELVLDGGEHLRCHVALWATGAAPPQVIENSDLPKDDAGFVRVSDSFRVEGLDGVFAVGDCAALRDHPWVPKAGVYAVRSGPVLDHNLRARLEGGELRAYRPQRDYLSLLVVGDREALGTKWGRAQHGETVWRLKDRIDRRFMRKYRVLAKDGVPEPDFPPMTDMADMPCGGCAAKLGQTVLERALGQLPPPLDDDAVVLGLEHADDAAVVATPRGDPLVLTVDAFRAFASDPFLVGRVAAVNALSDVYAKGGKPRHALALVTVPEGDRVAAERDLVQLLAGARAALDPLRVSLIGGHTTTGDELNVGFAVLGYPERGRVFRLPEGRVGDRLVLTKALGTGVVLNAAMRGLATGATLTAAIRSMTRDVSAAARAALDVEVGTVTDISGFGLAGHLSELAAASDVTAEVDVKSLPALPGALSLLDRGIRSTFHAENVRARYRMQFDGNSESSRRAPLLFDPQTAGGLLITVAESSSEALLAALHEAGDEAATVIGCLRERDGDTNVRVV